MITVFRWFFGYKLPPPKRKSLGMYGHHSGCWINDYDCGEPDCVMARHSGKPVRQQLDGQLCGLLLQPGEKL
jgi:hypothetical protein